ncbi:Piso0_003221 [Millerozyma farinosa CBS 7064]|uniref:Ubiquitin-activating enzyme E1-like n=1 Tax=Pichia sorbitophila (strain ATCC MYA-4447 / BCRC 22081 / CBS 7064 / NBRC 10061 / NRRL Y-12695) TaxID=559304 RepID=G8YHI5_PICSO|nr:Piso0_003221 [Millerozyma farinosa CBS 7064]CCE80887.1 Piso0_003221 [Millerozyma farinosa CBS 7064]
MVGAGGIGCELLKNLVLSHVGEIHIVDLDSITLSNLNRQFLFRQKDIDKSKSLTVAEAVEAFNYLNVKLVPHHGNIMDSDLFPVSWWSEFSYVFNALDNLEARRYVNQICLYLKKPLMESGTTGYDGQVQPIYPYVSECFDCQPKATPKSFPVCTIRSTPSQPVHCITWAKEFLFAQIFDETSTNDQSEADRANQRRKLESETEDKAEIENMLRENDEFNELRNIVKSKTSTKDSNFFEVLVNKIFSTDIERLLRIDSLWKSRRKPTPLRIESYTKALKELSAERSAKDIVVDETRVWSVLENLFVLQAASSALHERLASSESFISFDKDDDDTLNFVVASANIRAFIFGIELKSKFDIKQIAGNIIPAIATTNAIIAGFSCLAYLNYFNQITSSDSFHKAFSSSSTIFTSIRPNKYITSAALIEPSKKCPSCSHARGILRFSPEDLNNMTLEGLIQLIRDHYGFDDDISVILGKSKLIYDYDLEDNLQKKLTEINGFKAGETLLIQDESDALENLELYIDTNTSGKTLFPTLKLKEKQMDNDGENKDEDMPEQGEVISLDDDEVVELDEPVETRKRGKESLDGSSKKAKL